MTQESGRGERFIYSRPGVTIMIKPPQRSAGRVVISTLVLLAAAGDLLKSVRHSCSAPRR